MCAGIVSGASMRTLIALVLAVVLLGGCRAPETPSETLSLKLAVNDIYCTDTACECVHYVAARTYPETQELLKEQYGIDLQFDYYIEPYNLGKAILSGEYDGVLCKPWTALMLEKQAGTDFDRIVDVLDPENNRWLKGLVVVMASSDILTLDDLQGKAIVIGQSDAYEKHYAPRRLFKSKGIGFEKVGMNASCIESLGELMDGEVDAAVVSDYALTAGCAVDFASPEDFRIIGETEGIPLTSVLLDAKKVPATDRVRLQEAFLALTAGGVPESMLSRGFVDAAAWQPIEIE